MKLGIQLYIWTQLTLAWSRGGWHLVELTQAWLQGGAAKGGRAFWETRRASAVVRRTCGAGRVSILCAWFWWDGRSWGIWSGEVASGRWDVPQSFLWSSASHFMLWNFSTSGASAHAAQHFTRRQEAQTRAVGTGGPCKSPRILRTGRDGGFLLPRRVCSWKPSRRLSGI